MLAPAVTGARECGDDGPLGKIRGQFAQWNFQRFLDQPFDLKPELIRVNGGNRRMAANIKQFIRRDPRSDQFVQPRFAIMRNEPMHDSGFLLESMG